MDLEPVTLTVKPFIIDCTPKEQVLKPLEEAAEIYGAWQDSNINLFELEIADCIQACVNLAAWYKIDLEKALSEIEKLNRSRGRYGGC